MCLKSENETWRIFLNDYLKCLFYKFSDNLEVAGVLEWVEVEEDPLVGHQLELEILADRLGCSERDGIEIWASGQPAPASYPSICDSRGLISQVWILWNT